MMKWLGFRVTKSNMSGGGGGGGDRKDVCFFGLPFSATDVWYLAVKLSLLKSLYEKFEFFPG